jgi:thioesterase domain-containing protein
MWDEESAGEWRQRLQTLWLQHIPLAGAMRVEIRHLDARGLQLAAPLTASHNHIGTAFGGSLQGLATLAGWGVTLVTAAEHGSTRVVIRECHMRFLAPVAGELLATAAWPEPADAAAFRRQLATTGRARLVVEVDIGAPEEKVAARFSGEFAARRAPGAAG